MGGSQDKGDTPRSHSRMETILNNLQECLNTHDNRHTGKGVKTGDFAYRSFEDLKDDVLKEIHGGEFGIFVNAWSLCEFCYIDYTSKSSFLETRKKVRGVGFMSAVEACMASTFEQR